MKTKFFSSIRWKMILMFLLSIGLTIFTVFILLMIADYSYNTSSFIGGVLRLLSKTVGAVFIIIVTGIMLFVFYFFLFTRGSIKYIEEISRALGEISEGNLHITIPIRTRDELGELAENINEMAEKLDRSIQDERNAERTKNELITSVSHDLRTPLTSIIGYLELISDDKYDDEIRLRHYVDIVYQKSKRLKSLIDDLFELTTLSYGGVKLKCQDINIGQLLEQLAEEFVPILNDAHMEYRLHLPDEKVIIYADPDMLVRVFENLISNAVRYGREGKYIDIHMKKRENKAITDIINYGDPISPSELQHIFDRFYRVEQSRSRETGGTGLGLAIAKNIVELHGGSIRAYTKMNSTIFEVELFIKS
ncbi:sensor histidine kinase [Xylanivirga thermophila]|uniref:sensor histidine kinase n=1 Tax=Xylanivirga thermophila TaxID=2496273 RepID=UPI00101DFFD9|nr:HAMP domain-containing sensor histidine kinase [Xylanivirga thermophila]